MRGLQQRLEGRIIVRAIAHRPDLRWPLPQDLAQRLTGARVTGFRRRGKYILMRLAGGDSVLLHLGMSGRMVLGPARPNQPTLHEHLVLETDDGWRLGFVDPRRFGSVDLVATTAGGHPPAARGTRTGAAGRRLLPCPPVGRAGGQADADQGGVARPEGRGRSRQHLCMRGAVPRPAQSAALGAYRARARAPRVWCRRSRKPCSRRSPPAAPACATTCSRTASWATSSTPGKSTAVKASRASAALPARPVPGFAALPSRPAAHSIAHAPSDS